MTTDAILPAEVSPGKSGIDHGYIVAARCVGVRKQASGSKRYLQCLEVGWRYIDQIGHILNTRLRTICDLYRVVQCLLIRNAQPHSSRANARSALHGCGAFIEQLQERSAVIVTGIIERCFGNHHIFRVESRRQRTEIDERSYEQTRDREENNRQRHLRENQRRSCACAA